MWCLLGGNLPGWGDCRRFGSKNCHSCSSISGLQPQTSLPFRFLNETCLIVVAFSLSLEDPNHGAAFPILELASRLLHLFLWMQVVVLMRKLLMSSRLCHLLLWMPLEELMRKLLMTHASLPSPLPHLLLSMPLATLWLSLPSACIDHGIPFSSASVDACQPTFASLHSMEKKPLQVAEGHEGEVYISFSHDNSCRSSRGTLHLCCMCRQSSS